MIQISGPESVDIVKVDGINIFLFGDIHFSKEGLCKPCKKYKHCYYITDFIDNLTLQPVEIFLESPWLPPQYKNNHIIYDGESNVLSNVNNYYFSEMYRHSKLNSKLDLLSKYFKKSKKLTTIKRVHYTDIRSRNEFIMFYYMSYGNWLHFLHIIITYFPTCKHFKRFVDIILFSDNYNTDIKMFFDHDEVVYSMFSGSKNINKVRKQFLKIQNPEWKKMVLKYYKHRCTLFLNNTKVQDFLTYTCEDYNKLVSKSGKSISFHKRLDIIRNMVLDWNVLIMDMYHLARMLYYIEQGDSKVFVSYTGLAHTQFYKVFFTKYMKGKIVFSSIAEDTKNKKCLLVPENVLSKFMPVK